MSDISYIFEGAPTQLVWEEWPKFVCGWVRVVGLGVCASIQTAIDMAGKSGDSKEQAEHQEAFLRIAKRISSGRDEINNRSLGRILRFRQGWVVDGYVICDSGEKQHGSQHGSIKWVAGKV
jgi:hypothetical protein